MIRRCHLLLLLCLFGLVSVSRADTINFTVTITSQQNIHTVPVGTVYTGYVHFAGSALPGFTGFPPLLDSYGFDYPSAPASLSDMQFAFIQHHDYDQPFFVEMMFVNPLDLDSSFLLIDDTFQIIHAYYIGNNEINYTEGETGTVTYSYEQDPPSSVPEPLSLSLVGTGLAAILTLRSRRIRI